MICSPIGGASGEQSFALACFIPVVAVKDYWR
jgi:hypothetical protein